MIKLWYCDNCGQENTDDDVKCTQCHKEYEDEEMTTEEEDEES